ncbi:MAG: hypothetical protein ABI837_11045 [Acidobacteriota bacterium]
MAHSLIRSFADWVIGVAVAGLVIMARRVFAFFAMVAVVAIAVALMWRVYRHRQMNIPPDEPAIVQQTLPQMSESATERMSV